MVKETSLIDVLLGVLLVLILILASGITLSYLWSWFVVAPFSAPKIGIAHACGLSLLIALLRGVKDDDDEDKPFAEKMLVGISLHVIVFVMGWVLHLWM